MAVAESKITMTVACSPEWKRWSAGLAAYLRVDRSKLVDLALVDLAERHGYDVPAPARIPNQEPTP